MKTVQCRIGVCYTNLQSDVEVGLFSLCCLSERGVSVSCHFGVAEQKKCCLICFYIHAYFSLCVVTVVLNVSGNLHGYKWSGHNPWCGCFPCTLYGHLMGFLGARYHFVYKSAQSASPTQSSCCSSPLLPGAGDNSRSKAVPQNKIVQWGCTMCVWDTSELRNTRSVLFWGSCRGLLVYTRVVSVCILGGFKVVCRCSVSVDNT